MNGSRERPIPVPSLARMLAPALLAVAALAAVPGGARALDSGPWDRVLRAHAHRGGVDYGALKADEEAMGRLDAFLESAATMPESAPLSAWLNVYNAIVVKSVVERYPLDSVRSVDGFFDGQRHRVAGRGRTLDDIEHRVIRPRFRDARIHVALNCAARSCPALHPRAFRESTLDATLDRLARATVASRRHVRVDGERVRASQLFEWFSEDFERDAGSVLGWLRRFDAGDRLEGVPDDADVGTIRYDWRLNDAPRR